MPSTLILAKRLRSRKPHNPLHPNLLHSIHEQLYSLVPFMLKYVAFKIIYQGPHLLHSIKANNKITELRTIEPLITAYKGQSYFPH